MFTNPVDSKRYFTPNTALAAWLYMNGINLEGVTGNSTVQVIFNDNKKDIDNLVEEFELNTAHGNIQSFFQSYKYILSIIKDR